LLCGMKFPSVPRGPVVTTTPPTNLDGWEPLCALPPDATAVIARLREKVEALQDTFQNGVRVNEKTNTFELTWTERQLTKAKEDADRLLRELNFVENK
jgi:hypothetical protein